MPIERIFIPWTRGALPATIDFLLDRFSPAAALWDLSQLVLVVPGGRAGRRLMELLLNRAEQLQVACLPPEIVTIGRLPELLYEVQRPPADQATQQLAWIRAIRETPDERRAAVFPHPPQEEDFQAWMAIGTMCARLHRELAADGFDFKDVSDCGEQHLDDFNERRRWSVLAEIRQRYLDILDSLQLWDIQTARLFAIRQGECHTPRRIVMVGTVDMNRSQRLMLDQVADRTTSLIFAPEELADRFDEHGCLRPERWLDVEVPLCDESIHVVDGPADQATETLRVMANLDGQYRAEQITVGVPDGQVIPYIEQQTARCGVPVRYGVGRSAGETSPFRLMTTVAEYVVARQYRALAALVRHPAVESLICKSPDWLAATARDEDSTDENTTAENEQVESPATVLDQYYNEHLPLTLASTGDDVPLRGAESLQLRAAAIRDTVDRWLAPLLGPPMPLGSWGRPILEVLAQLFTDVPLDRDCQADRVTIGACDAIARSVRAIADVPQDLALQVRAEDAIRAALEAATTEPIPATPDPDAVELLGWLELPLDDAPVLILTGMVDGIIPSSQSSDLFLPNRLRQALGIEDNDRRYARDAYALSMLSASRERLELIVGRRAVEGDPLTPSRLLFACDDLTAAQRAKRLFAEHEPGPTVVLSGRLHPGRETSALIIPPAEPPARPINSLRVTQFRDYLTCPYRFYLRHVLRLAGLDDEATELDGAQFGNLLHETLDLWGHDKELVESTDAEQIAAFLGETIGRLAATRFGPDAIPAAAVQVELARRRLTAFASWQAEWRAEGWQVISAEEKVKDASMMVDDEPFYLRGRIDRIDRHESSGAIVVFDYKSSDTPKKPEQAHFSKTHGWTDLQLPLYRHLVRAMGIDRPVSLGYIALPKDTTKVGDYIAGWNVDELDLADETAMDVIRGIRECRFEPTDGPPPMFFEDLGPICQDGQFRARDLDETDGDNNGEADL